MGILDWLFPKNYLPYSERHVPDYDYDSLRTNPKYDASNRPRGMSISDWDDRIDAEIREEILRDKDRLERLGQEAMWDNAKYYACHPEALKHVDYWEQPSERLLQAARDYHAGKLK